KNRNTRPPSTAPNAPPIVNNGASVPPDVPLPREIDQEIYFSKPSVAITASGAPPCRSHLILSYPTPIVFGEKYPTTPMATAPMAGNHIQCTGRRSNISSIQ